VVGSPVTCTATVAVVAPAVGTPTGEVTFRLDGNLVPGASPLDDTGRGTVLLNGLGIGTHTITASYAGTADLTGSSGSFVEQVQKAPTTTTVTCVPNPSDVNRPVSCTASVTSAVQNVGTPTGTATFFLGGVQVGLAVTLDGQGQARVNLGLLPAGTAVVRADYSGDATFLPSSGTAAVPVVATLVDTTATLSCKPSSAPVGTPVVCTGKVTQKSGPVTPTGAIRLTISGVVQPSTYPVVNGAYTFTLPELLPGSYPIRATYEPTDGSVFRSSNAGVTQTVTKAATTTTLTCTPTKLAQGQTSRCTASVATSSTGLIRPGGTVSLLEDGVVIDTETLDANGNAVFTYTAARVGGRSLKAWYTGDGSFTESTSSPVTITVERKTGPDLTVQVDAPAQSQVGNKLTVPVVVTNVGASRSSGGSLVVTLDADLIVTTPAGCKAGGGKLTCPLPAIAVGATSTVKLAVRSTVVGADCDVWGTGGSDPSLSAGKASGVVICGLGGSDTIVGSSGNDVIWGDTPDGATAYATTLRADVTAAAADAEQVTNNNTDSADTTFALAGGGNDVIHGGAGDDDIYGGIGADTVNGDDGGDHLFGGSGADVLHGNGGSDRIDGAEGADKIWGDAGEDRLLGGENADEIHGGAQNDRIYGEEGNDQLFGGAGGDQIEGGDGNDRAAGDADDTGDVADATFGSGWDTLIGNDGNDLLLGQGGKDKLEGALGRDRLDGGTGDDQVDGGDAADASDTANIPNYLSGGVGNDTCSLGPIAHPNPPDPDQGDVRDSSCELPSKGRSKIAASRFAWTV